MITHVHRPLRVVLYEGEGAIQLSAEARAQVMAALLDKGYAVTRATANGSGAIRLAFSAASVSGACFGFFMPPPVSLGPSPPSFGPIGPGRKEAFGSRPTPIRVSKRAPSA